MKRSRLLVICLVAGFGVGLWGVAIPRVAADEQASDQMGFVDEDGDGVNDTHDEMVTGSGVHGAGLYGVFLDEDGDGVNDLAQDADGDGVPNGMDADYVLPEGAQRGISGRRMGGHGPGGFVDEDGDGINDLMQDADGDGILNGMDADYVPPAGGRAGSFGHGRRMGRSGGFLDEDSDGINDLMQDADGDGILNGMDADYALPEGTATGRFGHGRGMGMGNAGGFVDEDKDGVNDLMQDADGDGVPNGMDEDYTNARGGMRGGGHHGGMGSPVQTPGDGATGGPPANASDLAQQGGRSAGGAVTPGQQSGAGQGRGGQMMPGGQMGRGMQQASHPDDEQDDRKEQKGN